MHVNLLTVAWVVVGLGAVVVELHSETVYLLAVAVAMFAAAASALAGARLEWQLAVAGGLCLTGFPVAGWARRRLGRRPGLGAADIGLEATVVTVGTQGLRVRYRGSEWDAVLLAGAAAPGDALRIQGMRGSTLELAGKN